DTSFFLGRVCVEVIERLGVSTESSSEKGIDGFKISGGEGYASPRCFKREKLGWLEVFLNRNVQD
ncbi:hypothetical protein A2U01_0092347, partial [Trifolium medium]|nr:hypothetical protein [Trifolium medium]